MVEGLVNTDSFGGASRQAVFDDRHEHGLREPPRLGPTADMPLATQRI